MENAKAKRNLGVSNSLMYGGESRDVTQKINMSGMLEGNSKVIRVENESMEKSVG